MSELEDKQRIYDLTSELEALKPKAEAYKKIVTDITDIITGYVVTNDNPADIITGYVATSDNPADAYEVVQAIADTIKDGLNVTIEDYHRDSLELALYRRMIIASGEISYNLAHMNEHFINPWDLGSLYEVELEFGDEDYSVFTSEVGDISEIQKSN